MQWDVSIQQAFPGDHQGELRRLYRGEKTSQDLTRGSLKEVSYTSGKVTQSNPKRNNENFVGVRGSSSRRKNACLYGRVGFSYRGGYRAVVLYLLCGRCRSLREVVTNVVSIFLAVVLS